MRLFPLIAVALIAVALWLTGVPAQAQQPVGAEETALTEVDARADATVRTLETERAEETARRSETRRSEETAGRDRAQTPSEPSAPLSPTGHGLVSLLATVGYTKAPVGYGAAARFQWARIPWFDWDSPRVRGELGVEGGLQWLRHASNATPPWTYREFTPTVAAQYNVWLGGSLAVYPRMELGVRFGRMTGNTTWQSNHTYERALSFHGGVGVLWSVGPVLARGEVATDAFRIGVGINFL